MKSQPYYKLKSIPEDFVVKEVSSINPLPSGDFLLFKLKKKLLSTIEAVKIIADRLEIYPRDIGYAGTKDKHAITEQICSIRGMDEEYFSKFKFLNMQTEVLGYANEPISLGMHDRNKFLIVIRNLDEAPRRLEKFVNYFGEQRFGENNPEIGKMLVKREFSKAIREILLNSTMYHDEITHHLEHHSKDFVGALKKLAQKLL